MTVQQIIDVSRRVEQSASVLTLVAIVVLIVTRRRRLRPIFAAAALLVRRLGALRGRPALSSAWDSRLTLGRELVWLSAIVTAALATRVIGWQRGLTAP